MGDDTFRRLILEFHDDYAQQYICLKNESENPVSLKVLRQVCINVDLMSDRIEEIKKALGVVDAVVGSPLAFFVAQESSVDGDAK
jgi:hypothetical protein